MRTVSGKGQDSSDACEVHAGCHGKQHRCDEQRRSDEPQVPFIESCTDANVTITVTPEERYVITGVAVRGADGSMTAIALTLKS